MKLKKYQRSGIKEIVITGIHIASYGKDFKENIGLIDLLEEINKIENIKRIRLSSLEPVIITNEFIQRLSKLEKICDHFHLSLQSGCNDTLKRMNRRYTTQEFEQSVKEIRKYYPNAAITTDIIVGFPGESEEEFEITYNFLSKIKFYKMHIFKYSKRKGTKAAIMEGQINNNIKEQRSAKLIDLSNTNQKEYNSQYIGKKIEVLFEERNNNYIKGHTTNYIVVEVETKEPIEGLIKNVEIIGFEDEKLIGKLCDM